MEPSEENIEFSVEKDLLVRMMAIICNQSLDPKQKIGYLGRLYYLYYEDYIDVPETPED
jgi:hypothetical protein